MVLSSARVIGHKEWTGRKSDPVHSMAWRRDRVARFTPTSGGHAIGGAIRAAYDRVGAAVLGNAKGPEVPTLDKVGRWQEFERGIILWHPNVDRGVAHVIQGAIWRKFWAVGAESRLGYPVTDETKTPGGIGRFNHFTGVDGLPTSIYWTPQTGAQVVQGRIREKWAQLGWERGFGYPTTSEETTPDRRGRYNHFTGRPGRGDVASSIYWTQQAGAVPVFGAFRMAWEKSGWERGPWGYPIEAETNQAGLISQAYENGRAFLARDGSVFFTPNSSVAPEEPAEPVIPDPAT